MCSDQFSTYLPVDQVLADGVVPVVLAALVPHVVKSVVVRHAARIVDGFQVDAAALGILRNITNDVESRKHREIIVVLAGEWAAVVPVRWQRWWRWWRWWWRGFIDRCCV